MTSFLDKITLYNDENIVAYNKPAGMSVQADSTGDDDLWSMVKSTLGPDIQLVNRLDRPVSGIVILAKSAKIYHQLQKSWSTDRVVKSYVAICEGRWQVENLDLIHFMKKGRGNKAIVHESGKQARLTVNAQPSFDRYSLCRIQLHTGRFHQIRLQLSHAGYPIKGDVKYGARRKNPDRSIHLHACQIKIGDDLIITAPFPEGDALWQLANEILK
jgi:23S rRNA pseudouridine1911/1915/1917 synthase